MDGSNSRKFGNIDFGPGEKLCSKTLDNDHLFPFFFKFSTKGSESNLVPEGEDSKVNYASSSSFLYGEISLECKVICISSFIVLYHPNEVTLPFFQTRLQTVNVRAHELFFQSQLINFVQVFRITVF